MSTEEVLTDAVNTIDLIQSIFFDREFEFRRHEDETLYSKLQACHEQDDWSSLSNQSALPNSIEFIVKAPIDLEQDDNDDVIVYLTFNGLISLTSLDDYQLTLTSANNVWLSREDHEKLVHTLNNEIDPNDKQADRATWIIEKLQQMQMIAEPYATTWLQKTKEDSVLKASANNGGEPIRFLRDWIWFPMIYTREKRGHIISWAPKYNITGFLCPGKPGCMCLEGSEKDVNEFVNDIKTVSWAGIPASHRKMSSRWKQFGELCNDRAQLDSQRLFTDMTEVKFDIHGAFANHNDLNKLQLWMQDKGCGEAFDHLFDHDTNSQ
ncbi:MAG: hypothetical protein EXX96DRAFT_556595 [Benjaminiella poitrasii]|nr:MAG: hypothetical protein EXX96DRAFT_556595 [Benjaminiella poitrasii]